MKIRRILCLLLAVCSVTLLSACAGSRAEMKDGYYTAEAYGFDADGWKEYISIYVSNNKIVTVEYDARNSSGFVRSWDMEYMRKMYAETGTYPNAFTRAYVVSLLNWQTPDKVEAVSGAERAYRSFLSLAEAAIAQAYAGDNRVAYVEVEDYGK